MMKQMNRVLIDVRPRSYQAVIAAEYLRVGEEIESALGRRPSRVFVITFLP